MKLLFILWYAVSPSDYDIYHALPVSTPITIEQCEDARAEYSEQDKGYAFCLSSNEVPES